jgi:hypothetical protein
MAAAAPAAPEWHSEPLFDPAWRWGERERGELDEAGFVVLPGLLTADARGRLLDALKRVDGLNAESGPARKARAAQLQQQIDKVKFTGLTQPWRLPRLWVNFNRL